MLVSSQRRSGYSQAGTELGAMVDPTAHNTKESGVLALDAHEQLRNWLCELRLVRHAERAIAWAMEEGVCDV